MPTLDQHALIQKLNGYLLRKNRRKTLEFGYCHGLTLLWLHKMSKGQESSFYQLIVDIILAPPEDHRLFENHIEEFIARIEWLQNPEKYDHRIQQFDIDKLLELPKKTSFSGVFNLHDLTNVLKRTLLPEQMICLSGGDHTIGIYCRSDKFYLYDPNYKTGNAKIFRNVNELANEIFNTAILPKDQTIHNVSLIFNIVTLHPSAMLLDKTEIVRRLTYFRGQLSRKDPLGMNPLYLAAENNDEETIKVLLEKGMNINITNKQGISALKIASECGYHSVVKLLLTHKANVNLADEDNQIPLHHAASSGYCDITETLLKNQSKVDHADNNNKTPLFFACKKGKLPVVKILLAHGANPLHSIDENNSILKVVVENKFWKTTLLLLLKIQQVNKLDAVIKKQVVTHQKELVKTFNEQKDNYTDEEHHHLTNAMTYLFPTIIPEKVAITSLNPPSSYSPSFFHFANSVTEKIKNTLSTITHFEFKF